ncbi:MAG: hypothetical protein E6K54_03505 [Gammaproteobacteria bacterium]|nr:MAG: hypothetical protein E6K54_03505 [Gammaproteobacteria bacterium]
MMFELSTVEFTKKYYNTDRKSQSNKYYCLDCHSGEGQINQLLNELEKCFISNKTPKKQKKKEFDFYLEFFFKRCININRNFSDAVEFLSIWVKISPDTLLSALKIGDLDQYFNRTEFGHDGDKWCFPKLLQIFVILVEDKQAQVKEILDCLFEIFNFFSIPNTFVCEIIGYDQLERCIKEVPKVFKDDLLLKINEFIQINNTIYLGPRSHQYLNAKLQTIDPILWVKKADSLKLAFDLKTALFIFPSHKQFDPKYVTHQPINFGKR